MAYIKKEPIVEFITKGLNNPDKTKAFGYDAIEILTEIEFSPTADVALKSEVAREIFAEIDRMCIDTFGNFNHRVFTELKKKYIGGE